MRQENETPMADSSQSGSLEVSQLRAMLTQQSRLVEKLAERVMSLENALSVTTTLPVFAIRPPLTESMASQPLGLVPVLQQPTDLNNEQGTQGQPNQEQITDPKDSVVAKRRRSLTRAGQHYETQTHEAQTHEAQTHEAQSHQAREPHGRRDFLRLAGAAAAGATVMALGNASPAAAVDGGSYSGTETVYTNTGSDASKSGVKGVFQNSNGIGVTGEANIGNVAAGVLGNSTSGYGVFGYSVDGYALCAGGNGRLGLYPHVAGAGSPTTGGYLLGDIVRNEVGDTFSCVVAGSGGAAKFRKIAGPNTAGQLHFFAQPTRFVNSSSAIRMTVLNGRIDIPLAGQSQNSTLIPTNALSLFGTVYGVCRAQTTGWVTLFPSDGDPNSGFLSATATFDNRFFQGAFFMAKLSSAGSLAVFTSGLSDVILDISGYTL